MLQGLYVEGLGGLRQISVLVVSDHSTLEEIRQPHQVIYQLCLYCEVQFRLTIAKDASADMS